MAALEANLDEEGGEIDMFLRERMPKSSALDVSNPDNIKEHSDYISFLSKTWKCSNAVKVLKELQEKVLSEKKPE